jgi:gentisate 1,2-dioxygenase
MYTYAFNEQGLSRTLGAEAERLNAGCSSPQRQDSASYVFHIFEGEGKTVLATGQVLEWSPRDTFVIPSWVSFHHECTGSETAYLFSFTEKPVLQALGFWRST